jgi:hypothetical protein
VVLKVSPCAASASRSPPPDQVYAASPAAGAVPGHIVCTKSSDKPRGTHATLGSAWVIRGMRRSLDAGLPVLKGVAAAFCREEDPLLQHAVEPKIVCAVILGCKTISRAWRSPALRCVCSCARMHRSCQPATSNPSHLPRAAPALTSLPTLKKCFGW